MKIGKDSVREILIETISDEKKADKVLEYITAGGSSFLETLSVLETLSGGSSEGSERLRAIYALLSEVGIADSFVLDPSITRGLDYYTGIVYETFLDALPSLGSVCSGGRYNNLASLYTKETLPGVGSSIGLDRLIAGLEELKSPILQDSSSSDVLIIYRPEELARAEKTAYELRRKGKRVDVYLEPNHKAKRVFDYAGKNNIPYSISFKDDEIVLKNHATRESRVFSSVSEAAEGIEA